MRHLCVLPKSILSRVSTIGELGGRAREREGERATSDRERGKHNRALKVGKVYTLGWGSSHPERVGEKIGGKEASEMRGSEKNKGGGVLSGLFWWKKVRKEVRKVREKCEKNVCAWPQSFFLGWWPLLSQSSLFDTDGDRRCMSSSCTCAQHNCS